MNGVMERKKILIVEDDLEMAQLTRKRLVAAGFDVLVVPDALLGVQEANRYRPDLVVLDWLLPAGGGITVLEGLRSSVYLACMPVLVITGAERESLPGTFDRMERIGIQGFLKKPFEGNRLVGEVQRILKEERPDD